MFIKVKGRFTDKIGCEAVFIGQCQPIGEVTVKQCCPFVFLSCQPATAGDMCDDYGEEICTGDCRGDGEHGVERQQFPLRQCQARRI